MTSPAAHRRYDISEYVRLEDYSNVRHEFLDGQIYAMAGGTPEHGTYAANVIAILSASLAGRRFRVQTSDVRIRLCCPASRATCLRKARVGERRQAVGVKLSVLNV